jgi:hypothetical protein
MSQLLKNARNPDKLSLVVLADILLHCFALDIVIGHQEDRFCWVNGD